MFVDRYEQSNLIEDCERFLKTMEKLKPYILEFNEDDIINDKKYLFDYVVGGRIWQPIIMITHDKCTFFANNGICKT